MTARCTRRQVAEAAGVSPAVVSYVLGGTAGAHRISEKTAQRVVRVSRELGYRPNIWGRLLKTQRSGVVVLLSPDLTDPSTGELIKALGRIVRARGLGLMLFDLGGDALVSGEDLRTIETSMAGAFLLHLPSDRLLALCERGRFQGKPFCVLGRDMAGRDCPSVEVDNEQGAARAVGHLLGQGVRPLGIIADRREYPYTQARLKGCRRALKGKARGGMLMRFRAADEDQYEAGAAAVRAWLERGQLPGAIFAMGDVMAFGALNALHAAGMSCPRQVRIVGFDDTPMARYASPPLSTVRQPFTQMAEAALDMVRTLLDGRRLPRKHLLLEPELIVRESSQ
ncbi:MAG: LacI family DNA-binding transcriptional regulator [Kiritimatiellae bacterium]|nr:LacI family DNA-binding transcriptional regulator [Kiritimatiellia bacterium]